MLSVLIKDEINPDKLTIEDFKISRKLIAMFTKHYHKLIKSEKNSKCLQIVI